MLNKEFNSLSSKPTDFCDCSTEQCSVTFLNQDEIDTLEYFIHTKEAFSPAQKIAFDQLQKNYRHIYGLDFQSMGVKHEMQSIEVNNYAICLQSFLLPAENSLKGVKKVEGNILLIHGYCDHAGILNHLIEDGLKANFNVFTIDLPGHGLSSGEPAGINDFCDYQPVLACAIETVENIYNAPLHVIGHSTGASIIVSKVLLTKYDNSQIKSFVLLSPLVRTNNFILAKKIYERARKMGKKNSPSVPQYDCHNSQYIAFAQMDSLQKKTVTASWFGSLINWLPTIESATPAHCPNILIVTGEKDKIVDNEYNLSLLSEKMRGATFKIIEGGGHHLPNESHDEVNPIRDNAFKEIKDFIKRPPCLIDSSTPDC